MREEYKDWLAEQGHAANSVNNYLFNIRSLETKYGSIEKLAEEGAVGSLLSRLEYSTDDERAERPNPTRLDIAGDLRQRLASARTALRSYLNYLSETTQDEAWLAQTSPADSPKKREKPSEKQRLALEADMQRALRREIIQLDPGLSIIDGGAEKGINTGNVDILCQEQDGTLVVIELKAGKTESKVVGQTLGYMGDLMAENPERSVRGIIVAHEFDPRTVAAARAVPNLALFTYNISFQFQTAA